LATQFNLYTLSDIEFKSPNLNIIKV